MQEWQIMTFNWHILTPLWLWSTKLGDLVLCLATSHLSHLAPAHGSHRKGMILAEQPFGLPELMTLKIWTKPKKRLFQMHIFASSMLVLRAWNSWRYRIFVLKKLLILRMTEHRTLSYTLKLPRPHSKAGTDMSTHPVHERLHCCKPKNNRESLIYPYLASHKPFRDI